MRIKRFKSEEMNKKAESIQPTFKTETKDDGTNEIVIYGDIGDSWLFDSTSAKEVKNAIDNMTGNISIRLNSPGGDAFDGIAIYNLLKNHDGNVTVNVDGWAASAASIIAMAADEIIMGTGTMLMVHEAWTLAIGNKNDISKTINALEGLDSSLVDIYMTRFKGERAEIETMMTNETWFTANEAVDIGLADSVVEIEEESSNPDPEAFKESVLVRFQKEQHKPEAKGKTINILDKFKRQ